MQLEQLFQIQQDLDRKIMDNHQLQGADLIPAKLLALKVELGELANETRCFKFWSLKPASEQAVILEEFVDGLHFIFSIGLDLGYDQKLSSDISADAVEGGEAQEQIENLPQGAQTKTKNRALDSFLEVYQQIASFQRSQSLEDYMKLFQQYVSLGCILGFQWEEIEQAYLDKNKVNHQRQVEGY